MGIVKVSAGCEGISYLSMQFTQALRRFLDVCEGTYNSHGVTTDRCAALILIKGCGHADVFGAACLPSVVEREMLV